MLLKILLVISIILQLTAAFAAIRLMRVTKFNSTWVLFTVALILMVAQQFAEFVNSISSKELILPKDFIAWITVLTSLCFVIGLFYVRKIIYHVFYNDEKRRLTEKRILNTIISTEEKERRRFSKDLHDGLGPLLSSVKLSVSALSKMEMNDSKREIIENADYVIGEAIKSLKEISNNLSPHILDNFGIARAISNFINKLIVPEGLAIKFDSNIRGVRFSPNIEAMLYRVVCELVNNAIKYAGARHIDVDLRHDKGVISLSVKDDGSGFDTSIIDSTTRDGMGLSNISSRISSLKGKMKIISNEQGTAVYIEINID